MKTNAATQFLGVWGIEARYFHTLAEMVSAAGLPKRGEVEIGSADARPERKTVDNVAVISIGGPISKNPHCLQALFGGAATVQLREELAAAMADPSIEAIVLQIDSPGGTVAGTVDFADDVAKANAAKPVVAYIEDLGASAAYWIASQSSAVYANRAAHVGSIGVFVVVHDTSTAFEAEGIKTHVISTGKYKGAFVEGTKVTDEQLAALQAEVDDINALFIGAVAKGRGLNLEQAQRLADGRVHVGQKAVELGLVDSLGRLEDAVAHARELAVKRKRKTDYAGVAQAVATIAPEVSVSTPAQKIDALSDAANKNLSMADSTPAPAPAAPVEAPAATAPATPAPSAPATVDVKVNVDTKEADAKLAELSAKLAAVEQKLAAAEAATLAESVRRIASVYGVAEDKLKGFSAEQLRVFEETLAASRGNPLPRTPGAKPADGPKTYVEQRADLEAQSAKEWHDKQRAKFGVN